MSMRITEKHLQFIVDQINQVTGSPMTSHTKTDDGKFYANIGNYHLSHAYGGVCLHRMSNLGGGVSTPLSHGHVPKRQLYDMMVSYLDGLRDMKEALS